jgi:hypothetical protein
MSTNEKRDIMNKIGQLIIALFIMVLPGHALALSIKYDGFECQNAVNADDPLPSGIPVQSRFEVIEDAGDGLFRLSLTGGLPRIINGNQNVCIDSDTAIGFSGVPAVDGLPQRLEAIDATGYFNGQDLIITVNSINTDLSARRIASAGFTTSNVRPISNTLILEHNPQTSIFRLKKVIHNRGYIHTSGATNSLTPFFETILPIFGYNEVNQHKILTPLSNIEYILE